MERRKDLDPPLTLDERRVIPVARFHVHDIDVSRYRPDNPGPDVRVADKPASLVPAPECGDQRNIGLLPDRMNLVQQIPPSILSSLISMNVGLYPPVTSSIAAAFSTETTIFIVTGCIPALSLKSLPAVARRSGAVPARRHFPPTAP